MRAAYLREKAADYLRLARSLSAHSPTRRHLIVLAERLEQQAKEFEDAGAQRRHDEAAIWRAAIQSPNCVAFFGASIALYLSRGALLGDLGGWMQQ